MTNSEIKRIRDNLNDIRKDVSRIEAEQNEMRKRVQHLEAINCSGETREGEPN